MRYRDRSKPYILLAMLAMGLLVTACGPSAGRLNQKGNEAYNEGAYDEALDSYQLAQEKAPDAPEPYYNAANTLHREQAYPEALDQMAQAIDHAEEQGLAEHGHYNRGNAFFEMQDWDAAVDAYREALLLDPEDHDAKYNLELALQRQQEQQQQEQQEQQQEQEDQQQQSEDSSDENDQEQDASEDSEGQDQSEEERDQPEEQPSDVGDDQEQESQPQQSQGSEDQEGDKNQQPGQVPPPGQRLTEQEAQQLLAAIAQDTETLQEQLDEALVVPFRPPAQDW